MVGALTQYNRHAKSQSTVIFSLGAMRVFAATTPSLILCPHPLRKGTSFHNMSQKDQKFLRKLTFDISKFKFQI